ncbi:MAG: DUF4838 domain-containing protein [Planctomycetota bacterium]
MTHRLLALMALTFIAMPPDARAAPRVPVADGGRALLSVVVGEGASERVRAAASELASYLGRIAGTEFAVTEGDGTRGLAVGVAGDFPALGLAERLRVEGIADREHYVLRSHPRGVYVIGATELAVEDAVWDLLHRVGYRQFFPGETWEVIPRVPDLSIAVEADQRPDYYARRIWYGYGLWDHNAEPYRQWCRRNRAVLGFQLNTGHAYGGLIRRNQAAFDQHPEFYGLVDGERSSTKICIGNPDLRKLIVAHALRYFEEHPDADSISMDPSDGGGWCQCERCKALGSISDRALTLANAVAEAVSQRFGDKYVGMYAYSQHSPPPSIRVHPHVIISVATGFIRGGYTVDELLAGWAKQGATLGIREYYNVNVWERDLPGQPRAANTAYLARTIPHYHALGARFMSAESGDAWGPCGLGYYLAARMLWDVDEAERVEALTADFLARAFGPAREPMAEFYHLIDGANRPLLCDDLLGRMYRLLNRAKRLADRPKIRERIHHLVLYTRYVELFREYRHARGEARQAAFETLIRHAYRMRGTMMIHTKALYRDLVRRDKKVTIPEGATWNVPEAKNPWKTSRPFADAELARMVADGIERYEAANIEPVDFGLDLVPAAPLKLSKVERGTTGRFGRGVQTFYTWVDKPPAPIELKVTGGLIKHYRDRGPARVDLWKLGGDDDERVDHGESAPDGVERTLVLKPRDVGLHKITVADGHDATRVRWPDGTPMTVVSSRSEPAALHGRWSLYFYVPQGTRTVGLFADGRGSLRDAAGDVAFTFDGKRPGVHAIPVPPGQDGALWKFHHCSGRRLLLTVPPFLARSADELLLPRAVVARDAD